MDKYRPKLYLNGFVARKLNMRITYLKDQNGIWGLTFTRVRKEKLSMEEKATFDCVREKLGLTYTCKCIYIFEESMQIIMECMNAYCNMTSNPANKRV